MAQVNVPLPLLPQDYYMSWQMFTQAAFNICVTLKDSKATYVNNACRQSQSFGSLASGFQQVAGTGMTLTINIPQSSNIAVVPNPYAVQAPNGQVVAYGYNLLVEDGIDNDYNDLYINVVAWATKG